jgi:hypothetical protein
VQTKRENASSTLRAELERLSGHDPVLKRLLQIDPRPTAEEYISSQWGNLPEEIDDEEQNVIDLLKELEKTY